MVFDTNGRICAHHGHIIPRQQSAGSGISMHNSQIQPVLVRFKIGKIRIVPIFATAIAEVVQKVWFLHACPWTKPKGSVFYRFCRSCTTSFWESRIDFIPSMRLFAEMFQRGFSLNRRQKMGACDDTDSRGNKCPKCFLPNGFFLKIENFICSEPIYYGAHPQPRTNDMTDTTN